MKHLAATCHRALECRDHRLFDIRIEPSGRAWFLKASLHCRVARQNEIIDMAEGAGISLVRMFTEGVSVAG